MKHKDAAVLLLGFATMFVLFMVFYPFDLALAGWSWWTVTATSALMTRATVLIARGYRQGQSFRESLAANYDGRTTISLLMFLVSLTVSQFFSFVLPSGFAVACGVLVGLPLGKKE